MNDLHSALAVERSQMFLTQARYDGLARLGRCCSRAARAIRVERLRAAGRNALHWLRAGQLAGYPSTCRTC
jgi:hypothetical protein